jgi:hypothetical protein
MAFDTLTCARRLKQAGVPEAQAEAMADATRERVVQDFATKGDIAALKAGLAALDQRLTAAMDTLGLRLTVRMGGLIAVGVAILAAIIKPRPCLSLADSAVEPRGSISPRRRWRRRFRHGACQ